MTAGQAHAEIRRGGRHIGGGRGVVMLASCPFCCSASVSAARGLEFDPPRAVSAHFRRCDGARSWGPRRTVSRVGNCARRDLSPGHVARRWDVALLGRPASRQSVQAAMRGANAAVVGIPGLALCNPIWTRGVLTSRDLALAVAGFLLLTAWKAPPRSLLEIRSAACGRRRMHRSD
jgi:hypothetical protein